METTAQEHLVKHARLLVSCHLNVSLCEVSCFIYSTMANALFASAGCCLGDQPGNDPRP